MVRTHKPASEHRRRRSQRAAADKGHAAHALTQARPAEGRERVLAREGHEPLWARLALDAIARHRATNEPLDRAVEAVFRAARAGPRERRRAGDAAFAWARLRVRVEATVDECVKQSGGTPPARRDRDRAALMLAELSGGIQEPAGPLAPVLAALVERVRSGDVSLPPAQDAAALPGWLGRRLEAHYGEAYPALRLALASPAPLVLATDPRHLSIDDLAEALTNLQWPWQRSPVSAEALRVLEHRPLSALPRAMQAHVWPMDDGSQAVCAALEVNAHERVLDLCAGGGGKTRWLLSRGAQVTAGDIDAGRLRAARGRASEASYVQLDGTRAPFADHTFDRVLVDAPCSGTGTLRRAPDLAWRLDERSLSALPSLQAALLREGLRVLKPGGTLVYATCSLLPDENEGVVDAVLEASQGDAVLRSRRTLTPANEGCDGFFIAVCDKAPGRGAPLGA